MELTYPVRIMKPLLGIAAAAIVVLCASPGWTMRAAGPPVSPVLYVPIGLPGRSTEATAAMWDTLQRLERAERWAASESLAAALVQRLADSPGVDSLDLSLALLFVANGRIKQRLYADGKGFTALERSIAIQGRRAAPGDVRRPWAYALAAAAYPEGGDPGRGRDHGEEAVRLLVATTPTDSALLAQAHFGLANALYRLGGTEDARAEYLTALRLRQAFDDGESQVLASMLGDYGLFQARMGEFDSARETLRRAVRIGEREAQTGTGVLETSLSRLSTIENQVGNLAESLELIQRAYELARRRQGENGPTAVAIRQNLANRLSEFEDSRGAAAIYRNLLPVLERTYGRSNATTVNARLMLADCLLLLGDTAATARELEIARSGLAGQKQLLSSNAIFCRALAADLEHARGHHAAARDTLEVAIRLEREKRDPVGRNLAKLYTKEMDTIGNPSDREFVERAGREIDRMQDSTHVRAIPAWPLLLAARAGAEARVGLRESAWEHALEAERLARERLGYQLQALPDARALQFAREFGTPCDLLVGLIRPDRSDEIATAWDRIVRWRGRVRHEIARRRPPEVAVTDTAVAAAHARWVAAQRRLGQLVVGGAAHPDDPGNATRFESARRDAEVAELQYVRLTKGSVAPDDPANLKNVLARLEGGQVLVAFAAGSIGPESKTLGAFVATGRDRQPLWVALGPSKDLEREVRAWIGHLAMPPTQRARAEEDTCRALGRRVRTRVWDAIFNVVGEAREVLIVPEGAVTELPWLALPGLGRSYLADDSLVIRILNAERDLLPAPDATTGRGLLAVGDPDFEHCADHPVAAVPLAVAMRTLPSPCAGGQPLVLPSLPAARAEIEDIARRWPAEEGAAQLLVGESAGELRFKQEAPGHLVIHLATHGVVVEDTCGTAAGAGTRGLGGVEPIPTKSSQRAPDRQAPMATATAPPVTLRLGRQVWLALAGANRAPTEAPDENEGLLTAEEIVTLDLRGTDWVVLSACHSGLAPAWAREGVLGMRRAFHLAGARAVIASQWPVGDQSTREWMALLYAGRARGATAGAAVGGACRGVLTARRRAGRSTHPFHWAAFAATGE